MFWRFALGRGRAKEAVSTDGPPGPNGNGVWTADWTRNEQQPLSAAAANFRPGAQGALAEPRLISVPRIVLPLPRGL